MCKQKLFAIFYSILTVGCVALPGFISAGCERSGRDDDHDPVLDVPLEDEQASMLRYEDEALVYANHFDHGMASLEGFITHGDISVEAGQLLLSHSPGLPGTFSNKRYAVMDAARFFPAYSTTLNNNRGVVSWSFNLSNENVEWNGDFIVLLAASTVDPFTLEAVGYCFTGGGMVGNRYALKRYDYGIGGGGEFFIDDQDGLGPLPEKGSVRITFDPATGIWSLYSVIDHAYHDPLAVDRLVGSAVETTHTDKSLNFFGFAARNGNSFYDNFELRVLP